MLPGGAIRSLELEHLSAAAVAYWRGSPLSGPLSIEVAYQKVVHSHIAYAAT